MWPKFIKINLLVGGLALLVTSSWANDFEIRGDQFFLNDELFFINAVGYSPWRPGQWPGTDAVDIDIVEYDFKKIKEAGFNTIRTWEFLTPDQLKIAEKYGLYVIQGIWIDPKHDFSDRQWQEIQLKKIRDVVEDSKDFDNILFYLPITEPTTLAVVYAGEKETVDFFGKITNAIKEIDDRPVSMDSWFPIGFLDHSVWDVVSFNVFMFAPESINRVLGFSDYVRLLKERHAINKPLFVAETGGFSVSEKVENGIGFGGNTEEEQSEGNINSIKSCMRSGAHGTAVVSWLDTWHYPFAPEIHDNEAWEWDGLIAMETLEDPYGRPRKTYYDLQTFFGSPEFGTLKNEIGQSKVLRKKANITLKPIKEIFSPGEEIVVDLRAELDGEAMEGSVVKYGFFIEHGWLEQYDEVVADEEGRATLICDLETSNETGYVLTFASIHNDDIYGNDLKYIKIHFQKPN